MPEIKDTVKLLNDAVRICLRKATKKGLPAEVILINEALANLEKLSVMSPAPEVVAPAATAINEGSRIIWPGLEAFGVSAQAAYSMRDSDFSNGCLAVYGKYIEILDSSNDTTHECTISAIEEVDISKVEKCLIDGDCEAYNLRHIFQDLVNRKKLPFGTYYVRVCW